MRGSVIVGVLVVLLGSLACVGGIAAVFLSRSRRETPAAFVGSAALRARVGCPTGTTTNAGADATVFRERLDALGIEGTASSLDASTLEVTVRGVAGPEVLRALLVPQRLAMSEVLEDVVASDVALPAGVTRRAVGEADGYFASSPLELGMMASWAPADARFVIGCAIGVSGTECEGAFVRTPPSLTNEHVAHAEVVIDEMTGEPQVSIEMTPAGASAFTMLTRALTRRRLAIVLDDRLMSAPVVMEEISGGRAVITLGGDTSMAAAEAEARTLAVALDVGSALGCAYEVHTLDAVR